MYINETHIAYYAVFAILGLFVGMFIDWMNRRLPDYKKVFSKELFTEYFAEFKPNYILMLITSAIYVALLYFYGIKNTFIANLDLIKFTILTPMLLSAFVIDYKLQIIPNRLNLTMFEIGLVIAFLYGLSDVAITINMALGMLAGGGIFLLITLIGGAIYGKEAMGFGDYLNDMSLLESCGESYCMKNGHPTLKALAKYVTEKTNDENGVMEVLKTL